MFRLSAAAILAAFVFFCQFSFAAPHAAISTEIQLSARHGICAVCRRYGTACCALQGSVQACMQCSYGYGYRDPGPWCRKYVRQCSRR